MPYKLNVDLPAVNAGVDYALLVGKSDIFQYDEKGKKTTDTRIGVKLTLALQGSRLTPLAVKFDNDPLPNIVDEQIDASCMECKFIYVQIPDCVVSLFSSSGGGIAMSATAQSAKLVSLSNGK